MKRWSSSAARRSEGEAACARQMEYVDLPCATSETACVAPAHQDAEQMRTSASLDFHGTTLS
jgi:hypothetical protein